MKSVADIVLQGAERFGPRQALADPAGTVTYAQLGTEASQLARALRALGLMPGQRSLLVLPNSVAFVRAHFANLVAGLVSVPCDAGVTAETLAALAASCAPQCLLTDRASYARLTGGVALPASIRHVVLMDGSSAGAETDCSQVWSAADLMSAQPAELYREPQDPAALAALMYTTGTTGRPKGVPLTHVNILSALRSIVDFVGYTPEDREVVILPLSHNFGLGHVYCNLMSGGAVYTEPGLARVGRVLKAVESFRATGFPGTPLGFGMLLDQYGPVLAQKGRSLRFSVINSAPLPPERAAQLQALLPQLDIMVYYGLTEASRTAFISLTRSGPGSYRSVGRPMPHVEVQVRPPGEPAALPVGETGEIVIRGPAVPAGYWENAEETNTAFRAGWLHTGDLGHLDANGQLWITGRIKDVINVGGYKVNPAEVEKVLLEYPGVVDVGVVGVEGVGGLTSENVVAALVGGEGFAPDDTALQAHCAVRLEKYKVPVRFITVAEIPRSNTGKIKRAELARQVAGHLAAPSPTP